MALNPNITKDAQGVYWLNWTADPTAEGYAFATPGGTSRTFNPALAKTKLGKGLVEPVQASVAALDVAARPAETDVYPDTAPPPPPPPPTGTVLEAFPGEVPAKIAAAKAGQTVLARGGAHPKLMLDRSLAATIRCDTDAYFKGIDTNGTDDWTFMDPMSVLPAEAFNYDITPFYLHDDSQRIKILGAIRFSGGYDAIKIYSGGAPSKDCVIDDLGKTSSLEGYGGDGIHCNNSDNLRIPSLKINAPWQLGQTPEHNDGIHLQRGRVIYIGAGVFITAFGPRSDKDSGGMFINQEGGTLSDLTIEGAQIHWQIGRGVQILGVEGRTQLKSPVVWDSGLATSPKWTLESQNANQCFDIWGIPKSDIYFQPPGGLAEKQTVFH